eukprot:g12732.t1
MYGTSAPSGGPLAAAPAPPAPSEEAVEIEFEIEAGEGRSALEIFTSLQQQLVDPFSSLRRSEFGQYCTQATLYSPDDPRANANGAAAAGALGGGGRVFEGQSQPSKLPSPFAGGEPRFVGSKPPPPSSDVPAREILELQEKHRQEVQRLELLLRERENISSHAKEMWLAESSRAAKLGESLERAERKINELEKNLSSLSLMYNEASQELRQLRHLFGNQPGSRNSDFGGSSPGGARVPLTGGHLAAAGGGGQQKGWLPQSPGRNPNLVTSPSARLNTTMGSLRAQPVGDDAILYEDELIQIGIKSRFRELDGEFAVFFGNKSAKLHFHNFATEYTVKEDTLLRLSMSTVPAMIETGTQHSQRVSATCVGPFTEPPTLRVSFLLSDNSPKRIQVRLPVTIDKFLEPLELNAADFFGVWRDHDYNVNEECAVVDVARRFQEASSLAPLARAACLDDVLKLLPGVDTNPDNLVLASRFSSDTALNLIVCRVEIGSGAFRGKARIACRSNSPKLAKGICHILQNQIGATQAGNEMGR